MSGVILTILSVIGIILLALLGIIVLCLLIALFAPVTYRVRGKKKDDGQYISVRAGWLGLFRVRFDWPDPGKLVVKVLWMDLADILKHGKKAKKTSDTPTGSHGEKKAASKQEEGSADTDAALRQEEGSADTDAALRQEEKGADADAAPRQKEGDADADTAPRQEGGTDESDNSQDPEDAAEAAEEGTGRDASEDAETEGSEAEAENSGKIHKIKYTILEFCDKIKKTWANLSYYKELLQDENTARLWAHVKLRLWRILKSIRPRHIRAEVLFGTGSPDTTGYAFAVYGMLMPLLGPRVRVTPDFSQAILEGTLDVSGHITLWVLFWNALRLFLDKKLHLFIKKLKAGRKENGR